MCRIINLEIPSILVNSVKMVLDGREGYAEPKSTWGLNALVKDKNIYFFSSNFRDFGIIRSDFLIFKQLVMTFTPGTSVFFNPTDDPIKNNDFSYPLLHSSMPYFFEYSPYRNKIEVIRSTEDSTITYISISSEVPFKEAFEKAKERLDRYERIFKLQREIGDIWVSDRFTTIDGRHVRLVALVKSITPTGKGTYFLTAFTDHFDSYVCTIGVSKFAKLRSNLRKLTAYYTAIVESRNWEKLIPIKFIVSSFRIDKVIELIKVVYGSLEKGLISEYEHNPDLIHSILHYKPLISGIENREAVDVFEFMLKIES